MIKTRVGLKTVSTKTANPEYIQALTERKKPARMSVECASVLVSATIIMNASNNPHHPLKM